jgi:trehalose-6-phosphate synthase
MVTNQLDFPVWKTKENIKVKQNTDIEYKYIILKKGKFEKWEALPNNLNRTINVRNNVRIVIHDVQGMCNSRVEKFTKLNFSSIDSPSDNNYFKYEDNELEEKFDLKDYKSRKSYYYYEKNLDFLLNYEGNKNKKSSPIVETNEIVEEDKYKDLNYETEEDQDYIDEKSINEEKEVETEDKIIMCSLYLPMVPVKNEKDEWELQITDDPLYNNIYKILSERPNVVWIGLLKNQSFITNDNDRELLIAMLQKKYNMYVVKLSENLELRFKKLLYCVLEPLFHYITVFNSVDHLKEFDSLWKAYKEFNEIVSKIILLHITENSLVFLHDFVLFLTPSFLYNAHHHFKSNKINNNIQLGLFVHAPFPSHDVFMMFPYREEILKSMMNCSIIGFHTFDSSRNFLTSCKRILLIQYESNIKGDLALSYYGRNVKIRVKHVSGQPEEILKEMKKESFTKLYNEIREKHGDKYIYISVDNLMFLPGIRHKIEAYKRFLREIGETNAKQNVLLQFINDTKEDFSTEDEGEIKNIMLQINQMVTSIKKEFGDEVIEIVIKNISYTERLAALASGKCLVKTCKRETFTLDIYEFLNLKILLNDEYEIGYIMSELSGVTTSLSGVIKVNTFDIHSIEKGFLQACQIHYDKQKLSTSQEKDIIHVKKNSISAWVFSFLKELKNAAQCVNL